jgi:osmoprotectant transport system permease protein
LIIAGTVPVILMALIIDQLLGLLEDRMTPAALRKED